MSLPAVRRASVTGLNVHLPGTNQIYLHICSLHHTLRHLKRCRKILLLVRTEGSYLLLLLLHTLLLLLLQYYYFIIHDDIFHIHDDIFHIPHDIIHIHKDRKSVV